MNHFDWLVKKVMWLTTSNQSALLQHSVAMLIFAYDIVFWWWNLQNIDVETIAQIRNSWNGWSWCRYSWTRQEDKALPFGGIGKTVFLSWMIFSFGAQKLVRRDGDKRGRNPIPFGLQQSSNIFGVAQIQRERVWVWERKRGVMDSLLPVIKPQLNHFQSFFLTTLLPKRVIIIDVDIGNDDDVNRFKRF